MNAAFMVLRVVFVCHRPLSPSSVAFVYKSSGETPCWHFPVSTPSAKHAGSSTALYRSKMALEWVSSVSVCVRVCNSAIWRSDFK